MEHHDETIVEDKTEVKKPRKYRILLHNDDYTPMEFVVHILQHFFHKNVEEATRIMFNVHHQGIGVAGIFPKEIAETKLEQVSQHSRKNQHPLKCTMEKE